VAATGPLPGVLTSLRTLSPGESVTPHRPNNLFTLQLDFPTQSGNHEAQHEHTLASKPHAVKHCVATTVHGKHRHELPKTGDRQTLQHNKAQQLRDIRFSQPAIQDRLTALVLGMRDKQSMQRSNTDSTVLTEGVSTPQENNIGFGFQSCVRVCQSVPEVRRSDSLVEDNPFRQLEWRRNPKLS
jgi:hypothetical protein